jgi:hypothetical protein
LARREDNGNDGLRLVLIICGMIAIRIRNNFSLSKRPEEEKE